VIYLQLGQINEKRGTYKPNENVIALQTYIVCCFFCEQNKAADMSCLQV
jgi:hypothetical protein